jgi:hypothetical protein
MRIPRRHDRLYVRSALATLAFYGTVLAVCAAAGYALGVYALAGLAGLLLWLYRGPLFGATKWPEKIDVGRLVEDERARTRQPVDSAP